MSENLKSCETFKKYFVWVYGGKEVPQVFSTEKPNTDCYWFEFFNFSYSTWKDMENECVDVFNSHGEKLSVYNFTKLKQFFLKRMLKDTNYPVQLERTMDLCLTKESYANVLKIHPRILRCVLNQIDVFNDRIDPDEERRIAKECAILFGKGDSVNNPHPYIILYCDLIAFWEKFGLNYYDLQKLPYAVFTNLKRMMKFENDFKTKETTNFTGKSRPVKQIRF